jgi:endonuclease G, mitochondrial
MALRRQVMDRRSRVAATRLAIAIEAGQRWQQRTFERTGVQQRLETGDLAQADSAERTARFEVREILRARKRMVEAAAGFPVTTERMIGATLDFTRYAPDEEARRAGRPVARIVELRGRGITPEGFGSGFLVSPRLLMTNHHVLPSLAEARGVGANFLHEFVSAGLQLGPVFELDPDTFFLNDEALDFALVALKPQADDQTLLDSLGYVRLIGATGKILVGHPISIIQYPGGGPKQYATTQNKLLDVLETGYLQYSTDTLQGSSGSPAFNQHWELVALHHSGVPMMQNGKVLTKDGRVWDSESMSDDAIQWVANEGVRVSSIVNRLAITRLNDPAKAQLLAALLQTTGDPLQVESGPLSGLERPVLPKETSMGNVTINISGGAVMYINSAVPAASIATMPVQPAPALPAPSAPILVEKKIRFDKDYQNRKGYDPDFLSDVHIPLPRVVPARTSELLKGSDGKPLVLKYHHFSLMMNRKRRLQMWSAVNVDYSPNRKNDMERDEFGDDTWIPDPRIPANLQIQDDDFYKPATKIDRGHIVRRGDNAWGDTDLEIEYANSDTFHWSNCTPQHQAFNRENLRGLWGRFETHITENIGAVDNRASIFAGPVLDNQNDPEQNYGFGFVQYPLRFWKVIAGVSIEGGQSKVRAYGFVFDQSGPVERFGLEAINFSPFKSYQRSLAAISNLTGVLFPQILLDADVLVNQGAPESIVLDDLAMIRL